MDADAIKHLQNSGEPKIINVDGINYSTKQIHELGRTINTLRVHSLSSIVDYYTQFGEKAKDFMFHIVSPIDVELLQKQRDSQYKQHPVFAVAHYNEPRLKFNSFYSPEDIIVFLATNAEDSEQSRELITILSSIRSDEGVNVSDDGFSQSVVVRTGKVKSEFKTVRSLFELRIRRSFAELAGSKTFCTVRFQKSGDSIMVALYETNSNATDLDSKAMIREYILGRVPDAGIIG